MPMPPQVLVQPSSPVSARSNQPSSIYHSGIEQRGAIFTRPEVVGFMLDLVGYAAALPLHHMRLLEPSFGHGDFLLPAVQRLLTAYRQRCPDLTTDGAELHACIRAVELHTVSFDITATPLLSLTRAWISMQGAEALIASWLSKGFLLTDFPDSFTHVIGNPPYIRQEMIRML